MKKIIIKVPKEEGKKWSVQAKGIKARRFVGAASVFSRFERTFPRKEFREKTAIVVKEYIGSHWENMNETLASKNPKYLLYTLACFLEDYISKNILRVKYKKYEGWEETGV